MPDTPDGPTDVPDYNTTIPDYSLPDVDSLVWFKTLSFDDPGIQAHAARPCRAPGPAHIAVHASTHTAARRRLSPRPLPTAPPRRRSTG